MQSNYNIKQTTPISYNNPVHKHFLKMAALKNTALLRRMSKMKAQKL